MTDTAEDLAAVAPVPALVLDLPTQRIVSVSKPLLELTGLNEDQLVGVDPRRFLVDRPTLALPLLVTGQIDGYEATQDLKLPDGRREHVRIWVRAIGDERPPRESLIVLDDSDEDRPPQWARPTEGLYVVGSVDDDWRIDRVTADVQLLLGYEPSEVQGKPVLSAIHPGDLAEFLTALGHAERSRRSVVCRLRLRAEGGSWQWCRVCVSPLAEGTGFAFMACALSAHRSGTESQVELQERLARILYEARAASALSGVSELPVLTDMPGLAQLSSREWQVLSALRNGSRASDIARRLGLAPSTVRNHLASMYRKLGVRSQVALLAAMQGRNRDD